MTTRRSRLLAVLLCAAPACVASDPPVRAEAPAEVPVDEAGTLTVLRASQKEPYGVPEVGDWGLTTGLTLAAVKWSLLSDEQLLGWARLWDAVRAEPDRPRVEYESEGADGSRVRQNLFDQSPRDGFCVAHALRHGGGALPASVRAFLEDLRPTAESRR